MANLSRAILASLIVVAVLVVASIIPRGTDTTYRISLPPVLRQPVNHIAYVAPNGAIRAIDISNADEWQISPTDGFYTWPTWSPDATQIVFSGVSRESGNDPRISLHAFDAGDQTSHEIYVGEPGTAILLAEGVVHYPLWSPDSAQLAFVAGTRQGLTLFLHDLSINTDADRILDEGPLWMSWSPDSQRLLVHRGTDHFLIDASSSQAQVSNLDISTGGYRVPAWKPDGTAITLVSDDGPLGLTLNEVEVNAGEIGERRPTMRMLESPVFLWSPDGSHLALANGRRVLIYLDSYLLVNQDLTLIPSDGESESVEIPGNVLAYFWSPDASKLAYVVMSETPGVIRWMIYDLGEGSSWPLVDFVPSVDQLTMFQFFDQYAYSHSLWSPDSDRLVFAGTLNSDSLSASTIQPVSEIIVVDVERNSLPRVLTEGTLGIWSPR